MSRRTLPLLALAAVLSACGIFGSDDPCRGVVDPVLGCLDDPGREITVRFTNATADSIHLFAGPETFPCCRFAPGESDASGHRPVVAPGEAISLTAGRNQIVTVTSLCRVSQAQYDNRTATFVYDGNFC